MNTTLESIDLDTITTILAQANTKMNLIILDACRDNPFSTKNMKTGGLAFANVPVGTFIGFAASPGHVSYDEGNTNSVYTEGILKFIRVPDVTIDHIFNNVNAYVREHTGGKQIPFKNSSLDGDFYFNFSKNSSDTKNLNLENKTAYSEAIKALFPLIPFGSSVGDVLAAEFGESYRNSFTYKDMPISGECTNNEIRYYWRSLEESKAFDKARTYLYFNNLDTMISMKESAIFYTFKEGKLFRMQVTFKFKNVNFYRQLMNALNIKDIKFWGKFFDYNDKYFTIAELDDTYNRSFLMLGDANSYTFCNADWFSRTDTINASIKLNNQ